MNQIMTLLNKELVESLKTFKLLAIIITFLIIGVLSPFIVLIMPDILESAVVDSGIEMVIPEPTADQSYMQFFSHINQLGFIVFLLLFGGILTNEISRRTLINLLTKGLKRHNVVLSKALFILIIWTVVYFMSAMITYLYTVYFFDERVHHLPAALSTTWLYGIFLISLIFLFSAAFKNFIAVIFSIIGVVVVMMILTVFPSIEMFVPQHLLSLNMELIIGEKDLSDTLTPVAVTLSASILVFILSIFIFNRKTLV